MAISTFTKNRIKGRTQVYSQKKGDASASLQNIRYSEVSVSHLPTTKKKELPGDFNFSVFTETADKFNDSDMTSVKFNTSQIAVWHRNRHSETT